MCVNFQRAVAELYHAGLRWWCVVTRIGHKGTLLQPRAQVFVNIATGIGLFVDYIAKRTIFAPTWLSAQVRFGRCTQYALA